MTKSRLSPTPFYTDKANPAVRVASGKGPYENTRKALAGLDLSPAAGRRVLLKPNAGRVAEPGTGITTHPQVVAAVIDVFREASAEVRSAKVPLPA